MTRSKNSMKGSPSRTRRISVRGVRRDPVDTRKLSRALIALAQAQAEAEAQLQVDTTPEKRA